MVRTIVALAALLLLPNPGEAVGSLPSPAPATFTFHEDAGTGSDAPRGRLRVDVRIPLPDGEVPAVAGLRVRGLAIDIPLERGRGRFLERGEYRTVRAEAVVRDGSLRIRVRGALYFYSEGIGSSRMFEVIDGPVFDLVDARVLAGEREVPFVVGMAGWSAPRGPVPGRRGMRIRGAGIPEGGSGPVLRLADPRPGSRWLGRVAGQALAAGDAPSLESSLDGGPARPVEGITTREAFAGATRVVQAVFDTAVTAPSGPRVLEVRARSDGRLTRRSVAFTAPEPRPPTSLAIGFIHVLEVRGDRRVWASGSSYEGALGIVARGSPVSPVPVAGSFLARSVVAGWDWSLAVGEVGELWVWGGMDGGPGGRRLPERWGDLPPVRDVAGGQDHAIVLLEDRTVRAFGSNFSGSLGDGTIEDRKRPVPVPGLERIAAVSAGDQSSMALGEDGTVWQWGGTFDEPSVPVRVPGLPPCVAIEINGPAAAIDREGGVWTWELDENYDRPYVERLHPVRVEGLPPIRAVASGEDGYVVADVEGRVWVWGDDLPPVRLPGIEGAVDVKSRWFLSMAILEDGSVWSWGETLWESWEKPGDGYFDGSAPILDRRDDRSGVYREPRTVPLLLRAAARPERR